MDDEIESATIAEAAETIKLQDANEWFQNNVNKDDFIVVKTNCEGSGHCHCICESGPTNNQFK